MKYQIGDWKVYANDFRYGCYRRVDLNEYESCNLQVLTHQTLEGCYRIYINRQWLIDIYNNICGEDSQHIFLSINEAKKQVDWFVNKFNKLQVLM
jgi:hypothetical protein